MNGWRRLPEERRMLYSPIGLQLLDDFAGVPPNGRVRASLELREGSTWRLTGVDAVITPSSMLTYPGLGRSADPAMQPMRRFRVTLEADYYRPEYLLNANGIEFNVHPYNDTTPPQTVPTHPLTVIMLPAANYPFPNHIRVLRGVVVDASGAGVVNAEVRDGSRERVLSDERAGFALPLRWAVPNAAATIDALDHRSGRSGQISVNLPADLMRGHTITIT